MAYYAPECYTEMRLFLMKTKCFMTKRFSRFAAQESLNTFSLMNAIKRAEAGSVDADLGGGVIKQIHEDKDETV